MQTNKWFNFDLLPELNENYYLYKNKYKNTSKAMTTITLNVPDSLAEYQNDTVRFIAAKLYESGKLSLGQAADMAKLTKRTFAELLSDYGVSYINYSAEDLKDELDRVSGI